MSVMSIDIFATTNPAFCSLVLRAFSEGYTQRDPQGVPRPLILSPLPLVLSNDIAQTLQSTNSATGLLPWIARNPEVTVGMAERLAKTAAFGRDALLFGLKYRILNVTPDGRVVPDSRGLARKSKFPASADPGRAINLANRLGIWAAEVRSPQTIFVSLGANR